MCIILRSKGCNLNHKTVLKLMNSINIHGKVRKSKYKSYKGKVGKIAPNIVARNFVAKSPYEKLTTDVTQFSICGNKVYLSPILDMFSNEILSYSISLSPNFNQTREMLQKMFKNIPENANPILHSDQGWQYQMKEYRRILDKHNIIQSMSCKGNCLDNSIMESFFGRLKIEIFYGEKFESVDDFIFILEKFINYYNNQRVILKTKGLTPIQYRNQSLAN